MFSFAFGVMLVLFGVYGRVSGSLPHDNPYWRARHPEAEHAGAGRPVAAPTSARAASAPPVSAPRLPGTTSRAGR
jgi:hypothetical protein